MGVKKYISVLLGCSLLLTACNEADTAKKDTTKSEQASAEEETKNYPEPMEEIIGSELAPLKAQWGEPEEVDLYGNTSYQFDQMEDILFIPDDNGIISSMMIGNKNMSVYGSSVGQTPEEVKEVMDDGNFLFVSEGEDEMEGGWLLTYQLDANHYAYYSSESETDAVSSILVKSEETTTDEMTEDTTIDANSNDTSSGVAMLSASFAGTEQTGSVQMPIVEVMNEGDTNASQITVHAKVYYSNETGSSSATMVYGNLTYLGAGQVGQVKLSGASAYSIDDVEILEVKGQSVQ